jgi:hypothetical protein
MTVVIVIAVVIAKAMAMAKKIFFHNSHLLICDLSEQKCGDSSSAPIQLAPMTPVPMMATRRMGLLSGI